MTKRRVGVLFGGQNAEHDVSCDAAAGVLTHLNREKYDPVPVRIAEDGTWRVASPGKIPARLDAARLIALTGGAGGRAEALASAIAVLESVDVVFPVLQGSGADGLLDMLGLPCVGDASGLDHELSNAVLRAAGFRVADAPLPGRKIGISVLQHPNGRVVASPPMHWWPDELPAQLDPDVHATLAETAIRAFRTLGRSGLIGVDFFLPDESDPASILLHEVITLPGLTPGSPYLTAWDSTGLSYSGLLDVLIDTAFARAGRRRPAPGQSPAQEPPESPAAELGITIYGCGEDEAVLFRAMAPRLGVTPTMTGDPVTEANLHLLAGNRHISVSHKARIENPTLLALSRAGVEYISTRSVGFNHIDVTYAASIGVTVENIFYSPDSVADYTLMLMLMVVRNTKAAIRRADIHDYRLHETRGRELRDLTVGVVGTGRIGRSVMDRLRGFGCRVLAYDSKPTDSAIHVPLDELLQHSDIVTLHTPLNGDTHHLLNARRIEQMKRGAYIINTGRGPLLDTEALVSALENGGLGGAALDVLEGEEGIFYADCRDRDIENKLLLRLQEMPNVIISPHTAYYTDHALSDTVENSIINCLKFESRGQRG